MRSKASPNPRHDAPREGASTVHAHTSLETAQERSGAKYPSSSPPTKLFSEGTRDTALLRERRSNPRLHHSETQKLSSFPMTKASERLETKTPPEHRLGRGSKLEHSKRAQPIPPPRESARRSSQPTVGRFEKFATLRYARRVIWLSRFLARARPSPAKGAVYDTNMRARQSKIAAMRGFPGLARVSRGCSLTRDERLSRRVSCKCPANFAAFFALGVEA